MSTLRFLYLVFVHVPAKGEINRRPLSNRLATVLHDVMPPEGAGQAGLDRMRRCRY